MATYYYSYHITYAVPEDEGARYLGLLVWDEDLAKLRYYGTRDRQSLADWLQRFIAEMMDHGSPLLGGATPYGTGNRSVLDYLLDRGGGGYNAFSIPEQIEADDYEDAARKVDEATSHELDLVIPEQHG